VRQRLGPAFLRSISELINRNANASLETFFPDQALPKNARTPNHNDHLDIFACSASLRKCAILELTRDNEPFAGHQAILLAFAAYLFTARKIELSLPPDLTVDVGFVRFRSLRRNPQTLRVSFAV
jgi:hypothetical protein